MNRAARRALRLIGVAVLGGVAAWCSRLLAHRKVPPPEGRWTEIAEDELQ